MVRQPPTTALRRNPLNHHLAWKRRIGHLLGDARTVRHRRVILIYHSVGAGPISLPETAFRAQMDWLTENADTTSLDNLLQQQSAVGLRVALTFDDGYQSLYRTVAPILRPHDFVAATYVNTNCLGDGQRIQSDPRSGHYPGEDFLTWQELLELRDEGWTIGSHGMDHVDLTRQSANGRQEQLTRSKAMIEERLRGDCPHFGYTWGNHNKAVRKAVAASGYRWAVAAHHGPVSARSDRYALPRIDIRRDYTLEDFVAAVRGDWDYLGLVQRVRGAVRRALK